VQLPFCDDDDDEEEEKEEEKDRVRGGVVVAALDSSSSVNSCGCYRSKGPLDQSLVELLEPDLYDGAIHQMS